MTNFVQIQSGNFRALVRSENLTKVEDKLAKVKPGYKLPAPRGMVRTYPTYRPGMSTLQYVRAFEKANNMCHPQHLGMVSPYERLNAAPATQYDPTVPLCVEDANPDYVPGLDDAPVKPKRARKAAKPMPDKIDELALSLSLLSDDDMARLALTLWMRYPRTCRSIIDEMQFAENLLTAPTDQGGM
jgi:hypothetical protein